MAYEVGQTDYKAKQIQQSVRQLCKYGLISASCQHFITTVVRRTTLRVEHRSAFAGTAIHIVDWGFGRGGELQTNGIERGFSVAPPLPRSGEVVHSY